MRNTKVGYVLSYRDPAYVRTRSIVQMLNNIDNLDVWEAINTRKDLTRYVETALKVIWLRIKHNPDVYVLGFRGHEVYWPMRVLTFPRPIIFDEFINMQDWLVVENKKIMPDSVFAKFAKKYTKSILNSATFILSDTKLDKISSSDTYGVQIDKYKVLYVATDESRFYPMHKKNSSDSFRVFFYGNLAPLHGLTHILEAANVLNDKKIEFHIVGGRGRPDEILKIKEFIKEKKLNNVKYEEWMNFELLPGLIASADVFIGGPLGDTSQSRRVITGKSYQSLAMGVPTIVGKIDEDVGFEDKVNSLVVDQGSTDSLCRAILWAFSNSEKLKGIGEGGLSLYKEKFSIDAQTDNLKEIISLARKG